MNIHFTSDNHFFHTNVIKYSGRPYLDAQDMNESMIDNWNAHVKSGDLVYCLGDWSFANILETRNITRQLNGEKHLILGNHDKAIIQNKKNLLEEHTFASIQTYKEISVEGKKIVLFHYGCRVWNKSHHGSWLLFGHSHGTLPPYGKSVDVGVDAPYVTGKAEYRPYTFAEVKKFMDRQEISNADHHHKDEKRD